MRSREHDDVDPRGAGGGSRQDPTASYGGYRPPNRLGEALQTGVLQPPPILSSQSLQSDPEGTTDREVGQIQHAGEGRFNRHEDPGAPVHNAIVPVIGLALLQRGGVGGASVDGRQTSGIPSASSHPGAVPAQNIGWTGEVQGLEAVDGTHPRFEPVGTREEFIPQPGKPRMALDRGGHASPAPAGIRQRTFRRAGEGGLGTTPNGDAISAPAPCDATTPGRR